MTPEQQETAKRWMQRPLPKSCTHEPIFFDPPMQIQKRMGGTAWFFEIGAKFIHRVGLMRGLSWVLPYGEAGRGINYVRISIREGGAGTYDMFFGTRKDMREGLDVGQDIVDPFRIEQVAFIENVHPDKLREVYDRETLQ